MITDHPIIAIAVHLREAIARPADELHSTTSDAYTYDNSASRHRSIRFASPSYRGALPSCAYHR